MYRFSALLRPISSNRLIVAVSLFLTLFHNLTFFSGVMKHYPIDEGNLAFLISLCTWLWLAIILFSAILCISSSTKPVLIALITLSSISAYYLDVNNLPFEQSNLDALSLTSSQMNFKIIYSKLFVYVISFGAMPALIVYLVRLTPMNLKTEVLSRLRLLLFVIVSLGLISAAFAPQYLSFTRHKPMLLQYANPGYPVFATLKSLVSR